jgi:hypothetical protein
MRAPLLMLQALMLLISFPTNIPADAGAPFDAESLDAAHVPPYNQFLLMLAPLFNAENLDCAAHVCTLFSSTVNLRESYGSQVY